MLPAAMRATTSATVCRCGCGRRGQAVAGGVDLVEQRGSARGGSAPRAAPGRTPRGRDRPPVDLDQRRRDEGSRRAFAERRAWTREAARAHRFDMGGRCLSRASALITGPTSAAAGRAGRREFGHRRLQHRQHAVGDVVLQAQHAQAPNSAGRPSRRPRRARRRPPVRAAPRNRRSSRSGRRSRRSAGSACRRAQAAGQRAAISLATSVEPVNITPPTPASAPAPRRPRRRRRAGSARPRARPPHGAGAPPRRRPAASPRPAWRSPRCPRRARRRSGR